MSSHCCAFETVQAGIGQYNCRMKPLPPPKVPGKTEFQKFDNAVRLVLTVSKEELLRREAAEKKANEEKDRPKKS